MFEQSFVSTGKTNKSWSVFLSFGLQMLVMVLAILIPLIYTDTLPRAQLTSFLVAPPPPAPPPPPPPPAPPKVVKIIPRQFDAGKLMAPKTIPKDIANIKEEELPPPSSSGVVGGVVGGVPGGAPGGVLGGVLGAIPNAAPPPPPVKEEKKAAPSRIRVGGNVQQANLDPQSHPVVSAAGQASPHPGCRAFHRHYRQGRHDSESAIGERPSAPGGSS